VGDREIYISKKKLKLEISNKYKRKANKNGNEEIFKIPSST
jgi:hypothetical protein